MKMKVRLLVCMGWLMAFSAFAQWHPAGDKIKTRWASQIDVNNVLPEYPRPIMERAEWQNLNGLWNYAILPIGKQTPSTFDCKILVPFAIESSLSGVQKKVGRENELWYQREFTIPSKWKNNRILLHFGAVDWKADVWVNDIKVGRHTGGYTPFSFDITSALKSGSNTLVVKVWDPTNDGYQPRGKQVNRPEGIWYTSVTGIWQTVWLEPVPEKYITNVKITPDIDKNILTVEASVNEVSALDKIEVKVMDGSQVIASGRSINHLPVEITMPEQVKLWSPDSPFLYDLEITLWSDNKPQDKVNSYAAMRKYSIKRDNKGIVRLQLNNKDLFQFGPLDQGWWPDGLYTAPTDDALKFDIQKTKDLGFNMIRKHVKVEPARCSMHCDRLGMIVWVIAQWRSWSPLAATSIFQWCEWLRSPNPKQIIARSGKKSSIFCIPILVAFGFLSMKHGANLKRKEIAEWTKQYDPSAWLIRLVGAIIILDMLDLHNYPHRIVFV